MIPIQDPDFIENEDMYNGLNLDDLAQGLHSIIINFDLNLLNNFNNCISVYV